MKSLIQAIIRVCYPYGVIRRVWRGPLRGCRYVVRPGIGLTIAWGMDNMFLGFLSQKIQPGQVIYDVGANCGLMSLFLSPAVGESGRVIAFEPMPGNVEIIRRNLLINDMHNVQVQQVALDRVPGHREFLFDPQRHTMGVFTDSCVKMQDWSQTVSVPCESIDSLIAQGMPRPDVIKIDVEGAAAEVLGGAEKLLAEHPPRLFIELHALNREAGEMRLVSELRARWGYQVEDVAGTLRDEPGIDWSGSVWCDPPSIS